MNHPAREEWMSYLYGELNAGERANLATHLLACADCSAKVNGWQAARRDLDAWRLRSRGAAWAGKRIRTPFAHPVLKWAAAAILLSAAFGLGRLAPATASVDKVRAAIEPAIRQELRREFSQWLRDELNKTASATLAASGEQTKGLIADYAAALESNRTEEDEAIYAALDKLDSQRLADFISLKKDMDTVAVNTDAGLRQTEQQLVQLADYAQPARFPNSPQN
jgi:anti-sigma factor RsiW